jgi:hypothetical protein
MHQVQKYRSCVTYTGNLGESGRIRKGKSPLLAGLAMLQPVIRFLAIARNDHPVIRN